MKKTTQQMRDELAQAYLKIRENSQWYHYKGGVYKVRGFGFLDGELIVRYKRIDGPNYEHYAEAEIDHLRPFSEWFDDISLDQKRFTKVHQSVVWRSEEGAILGAK